MDSHLFLPKFREPQSATLPRSFSAKDELNGLDKRFKLRYVNTKQENLQITKENVGSFDFSKILESVDMQCIILNLQYFTAPLFVGMSNFDYLKDDEERRVTWLQIAQRVIPFLSDSKALMVLREEQKRFENSKILNTWRTEQSPIRMAEEENHKHKVIKKTDSTINIQIEDKFTKPENTTPKDAPGTKSGNQSQRLLSNRSHRRPDILSISQDRGIPLLKLKNTEQFPKLNASFNEFNQNDDYFGVFNDIKQQRKKSCCCSRCYYKKPLWLPKVNMRIQRARNMDFKKRIMNAGGIKVNVSTFSNYKSIFDIQKKLKNQSGQNLQVLESSREKRSSNDSEEKVSNESKEKQNFYQLANGLLGALRFRKTKKLKLLRSHSMRSNRNKQSEKQILSKFNNRDMFKNDKPSPPSQHQDSNLSQQYSPNDRKKCSNQMSGFEKLAKTKNSFLMPTNVNPKLSLDERIKRNLMRSNTNNLKIMETLLSSGRKSDRQNNEGFKQIKNNNNDNLPVFAKNLREDNEKLCLKIANFQKDYEDHKKQNQSYQKLKVVSALSSPDNKKIQKRKKGSLSIDSMLKCKSRGEIMIKVQQKLGNTGKNLSLKNLKFGERKKSENVVSGPYLPKLENVVQRYHKQAPRGEVRFLKKVAQTQVNSIVNSPRSKVQSTTKDERVVFNVNQKMIMVKRQKYKRHHYSQIPSICK